jgi:hypothetical protein
VDQVAVDAAKATPPVAVSVLELSGMNLPDLALVATIVYTLLLIAQHVWSKWCVPIHDWWRERRRRRQRRRRRIHFTNDEDEVT